MAELKTVFTDDDGDGIFDDAHVVNVMEEDSSRQHYQHHHRDNYTTSHRRSRSTSVLSTKTKLKIFGITAGIFFGLSLIVDLILFIICLIAG